MKKTVYCLKSEKRTHAYHLFKTTIYKDSTSKIEQQSLCSKMNIENSSTDEFMHLPEVKARIKAAKVGRQVCASCITQLYTHYD